MSDPFVERERKFDVEPDFEIPDLGTAIPPGSTVTKSVQQLRSDYFDTRDGALLRSGITFRRRTGTDDTGWHLKLPHGEHREELHADLSEDLPIELTRLLLGVVRGAPLSAVASLQTERRVTRILDAAGDPVADIDLDAVQATTIRNGRKVFSSWTELEIELGSTSVSDEQLAVLAQRIRDAGARPPKSGSKLARALEDEPAPDRKEKPVKRKNLRADDVLLPYLVAQQQALLVGDVAVRRGDDTVIRKTRVATRRLRSTLRVFAPYFAPGRREHLDEELRWYAEILGAVRDGQVLQQRLDEAVRQLPPELVLGPVQQRIDAHLHANQQRDWARLQTELTQPRYLNLLTDLVSFLQERQFTSRGGTAEKSLVHLARTADRKVGERLEAANRKGDVELLHRARKAAKHARYAAEAVRPITGTRATHDAKRYERLQDLLGEHQDSVVAAQVLRELGAAAGVTPGENGFTFGLLFTREQEHAEAARREARKAARRFR